MENQENKLAEELKAAIVAHLELLTMDELMLIYELVRKLAKGNR